MLLISFGYFRETIVPNLRFSIFTAYSSEGACRFKPWFGFVRSLQKETQDIITLMIAAVVRRFRETCVACEVLELRPGALAEELLYLLVTGFLPCVMTNFSRMTCESERTAVVFLPVQMCLDA